MLLKSAPCFKTHKITPGNTNLFEAYIQINTENFLKSILIGIIPYQNPKQECDNRGSCHDNQNGPEHFWKKVIQNDNFPYPKDGNHRKDEDKCGKEISYSSFNGFHFVKYLG